MFVLFDLYHGKNEFVCSFVFFFQFKKKKKQPVYNCKFYFLMCICVHGVRIKIKKKLVSIYFLLCLKESLHFFLLLNCYCVNNVICINLYLLEQ